jgi:hypothetical protein
VAAAEPAFSLAASDLARACHQDRAGADKKYGGAVVELSGAVRSMGVTGDAPHLGLASDPGGAEILCFTSDKEPWERVAFGQQVRLKGRWPAGSTAGQLVDCVIVEAGANPAARIAAERLAGEFNASRRATNSKYRHKSLIIDGEVLRAEAVGSGLEVYIKVSGPTQTTFRFLGEDGVKRAASLKPGDRVRVLARYTEAFRLLTFYDPIFLKDSP